MGAGGVGLAAASAWREGVRAMPRARVAARRGSSGHLDSSARGSGLLDARRRRADRRGRGRAAPEHQAGPGRVRRRDERARAIAAAGLELICRCDPRYPARLDAAEPRRRCCTSPAGWSGSSRCSGDEPVAIVGARRASATASRSRARSAAASARAGVTVISGMALGIDSAAHAGALAGAARPSRCCPAGPSGRIRPRKRALHREIVASGRGRLRAAARDRDPALDVPGPQPDHRRAGRDDGRRRGGRALRRAAHRACARELGRPVGAVPGRVTSPPAAGPNALLARRRAVVRGAQDVLDALFGAGVRARQQLSAGAELDPEQSAVLAAIASGHDSAEALARAGLRGRAGDWRCSPSLELAGYIRREPGGRFAVVPGV